MCNPESIDDLVELLIPELQRRGIYQKDYPAPSGTLRENMQNKPGQPLAGPEHPAAKLRWDKVYGDKATNGVNGHKEQITSESLSQIEVSKNPAVAATEVKPVAVTTS
jgi:hypothetical protein